MPISILAFDLTICNYAPTITIFDERDLIVNHSPQHVEKIFRQSIIPKRAYKKPVMSGISNVGLVTVLPPISLGTLCNQLAKIRFETIVSDDNVQELFGRSYGGTFVHLYRIMIVSRRLYWSASSLSRTEDRPKWPVAASGPPCRGAWPTRDKLAWTTEIQRYIWI